MPYQSMVMLIGRSCSKFTEPRKQKLKVLHDLILHDLKEFLK